MVTRAERQALATGSRWWPAAVALLVLGVIDALLSDRLTLGPPWALLVLAVVVVIANFVLRWRGLLAARRWIAMGAIGATSIAVTASAGFLVNTLLSDSLDAPDLLRGAGGVYISNVLVFALWYWEMDGGGPARRHLTHSGSIDFAFPQRTLNIDWTPEFIDYVFLAFNTSTAFSPTDTMVLGRQAKVLMMWQSVVSLVTVAVIAARAINILR